MNELAFMFKFTRRIYTEDMFHFSCLASCEPFPNTFLTKIVSIYHENAVECDERTDFVVHLECSRTTMLDCEGKCEIPHEASLFVYH